MMAVNKKYFPYPRRKIRRSSFDKSATTMLALLVISVPTVQPFLMPPPPQVMHRHRSPHSFAPPSSLGLLHHVSPSSGAVSSIPRRNARLINSYGRHRNIRLYASTPGDGAANDGDNLDDGQQMPSDDVLFGNSIGDMGNADDDLSVSDSTLIYGEEDDEDDYEDDDPYARAATSEFTEDDDAAVNVSESSSLATALARQSRELNTSPLDWGGALSTLRSRVSDIESGRSVDPSNALFRTVSRERPNEAIGRFVREANPEVVAAMTGAVGSLLGSLSNPAMGVETIVQASSEKLGNLCFQLMMTGYMFRNAEYVLALKALMNIGGEGGAATLEDYRAAFQRIDTDGSGYLERDEIEALLADVYDEQPPAFEITTFLEFFDSNNDGRVSWEEFEKGFGVVSNMSEKGGEQQMSSRLSLPGSAEDDDAEEDLFGEPSVSGTIEVELEDGRVIEVDAQEYMDELKQQALELKMELAREKGIDPKQLGVPEDGDPFINQAAPGPDSAGGIASYIASLEGDVKALTQGISPEVVDAMKKLIDFVLEGGPEGSGNSKAAEKKKEMELPGSALQQLALWQLVIGYRLRETEATGDWRQMLE